MADQLRTTEADLYERLFPGRDPQRWPAEVLGQLLQAPVSDIPTAEDLAREQGQIGVPTDRQRATETGQNTLDYVTTLLGPLMAMMGSRQYARTDTGKPARTWKDQTDYSKANSPLEQLLYWKEKKPWENQPPIGESAWTHRQPPQIGGPTGRGMSKEDILKTIEQEKFKALLKQINESEALEAMAPRPRRRREVRPVQGDEDELIQAALRELLSKGNDGPLGAFKLPPLPGD